MGAILTRRLLTRNQTITLEFWSFLKNSSTGGLSSNRAETYAKAEILASYSFDVAGAPGSANGTPLQLWDCEGSGHNRDNGSATDQRWTFVNGFIRNDLSGKCIDVAGAPGSANGIPLQLWDCETSGRNRDNGSATDQRWGLH